MKTPKEYMEEVKQWANADDGILALGLIGSHARKQATAESDIDFMLICEDPLKLVNDLYWISQFGEVKSHIRESWGIVTSIRVFYNDGQEIEFGLASKEWANIPIDEGTRRVISDGMVILKDSGCLLSNLQKAVLH